MHYSRLILASKSPRRRQLLTLLGLPFEVTVADVKEIPKANEMPAELVVRLSFAKAASADVADQDAPLFIGCDTVVALEGDVLGKPRDANEAKAMLRRLRGRHHTVYSSVTLWAPSRRTATELADIQVTMRNYTEAEIHAYVASGDPFDKAGAYAIQHQGFNPVKNIAGCYAGVMGLPLCHLARRLRSWGIEPNPDLPAACQARIRHRCTVYQEIMSLDG